LDNNFKKFNHDFLILWSYEKTFFDTILALIVINTIHSQTRGTKVGYIDMEYILQNVPNYAEATIQLEQKRKNGNKKLRPKNWDQ
jgi:Skp family chaperone for outer membrane proteins